MIKKLTSWSFSRLKQYEECPAKAKFKNIDRLPEPPSTAMDKGMAVHKMAEAYIKGGISERPLELIHFGDLFNELRDQYAAGGGIWVEESWCFDKDWEPVEYDDWDNVRCRIKVDVAAFFDDDTLEVIDWKTGQPSKFKAETYEDQLQLYALGGLLMHLNEPNIVVRPLLYWLDVGQVTPNPPRSYTLSDLDWLKVKWEGRAAPLLSDESFAPRAGRHCQWCAFAKDKGGPCPL